MHSRLRIVRWAGTAVLAAAAGCTTLSTEPLAPPLVRSASVTVQNATATAESKLPVETHDWLHNVKHFCRDTKREIATEYHRNNDWPFPYSDLAVHAVRQPMDLQAQNARLQMLSLWDYHFDPGTGKLNTMGRRRLEDIVDQATAEERTVYVRRAPTAKETSARLASARTGLQDVVGDETSFQVVEAQIGPSTVTGDEAQRTLQRLTNPTNLKASSSSGGESSSSASSSGGGS